ncbi:MAG: RDD family protein [Gammaproteobacteria bacterium]|nr:RDD family protein [Gammaproteobacteria bacterium]
MSQKKKTTTDNLTANTPPLPPASFLKLLGCWLYDFMLLCAVWLLAGFVYIIPAQLFTQIDSTQKENLSTTEFSGPVFYSYLFIVTWFFFAWFWTHGGQTLGLRSWSLRLQTVEGHTLNWTQTFLRFLVAGTPWLLSLFVYDKIITNQLLPAPYQYSAFIIGFIGLLWMLVDKDKRSIQDIFSNSRIVSVPKKASKQKLY